MSDKRIWIIFLIMFINLLGVGIIFPFLPYYAEHLGANTITIGFLAIAYPVFSLMSGPILGKLSDRYGRRPILLFSVLGTVIGFLILGYAKTLPLLFLARIVDGASAGNTPTAFAYIADITTEKERTHAMSIITSSFWSGIALGFIIGGLLASYGQSIPSFIAAGITFIGLLLAFFYLPETYTSQQSKNNNIQVFSLLSFLKILSKPTITNIMVLVFIREILSWFYDSTVSLFTEHFFHATSRDVGFLFAYIAIIGTCMQLVVLKKLLVFISEKEIIFLSFTLIILGLLFLGMGNTLFLFFLGTTLMTIGCSITSPVFTGLISKFSHKDEQGKMMGIMQMVTTTGSLLGPLFALYLFGLYMRMQYYVGVIIGVLAILILYFTPFQKSKS